MKDIYLSERLKKIAEIIPPNSIVADIGTDHAYLPIFLVKNKISPRVIAVEAKKGPYERALKNVFYYHCEGNIEVRLGQGLKTILPEEIDVAVIAGMGGETIKKILVESKEKWEVIPGFILQPMKNLCELRRFLLENRFLFKDELVIKESNRFYEIWVVTQSKDMEFSFDYVDILIGPILKNKREEIVKEYLNDRINRLKENYRLSAKGKDKVKQEEILKKLKILTEVLNNAFLCHDYQYNRKTCS